MVKLVSVENIFIGVEVGLLALVLHKSGNQPTHARDYRIFTMDRYGRF